MKFNIKFEDEAYVNALKRYYKKHGNSDVELIFNQPNDIGVIICSQHYAEEHELNYYLILSDKNQVLTKEINQYQSGKDLLLFLASIHESDLKGMTPFKLYGFVNALSTAGATTLSLNLADYLSQKGKTLWFSLESAPSTLYYMDKKSGISLSDILFYLENDWGTLEKRLKEWTLNGLYWFDQVESLEDLEQITPEQLIRLIELLEYVGFSNVVMDLGFQLKWQKHLIFHRFVLCMLYDQSHFYRWPFKHKTMNTEAMDLFVNRRHSYGGINESALKMMDHYYYIDEDNDLEERQWISKTMQSMIGKHLNII